MIEPGAFSQASCPVTGVKLPLPQAPAWMIGSDAKKASERERELQLRAPSPKAPPALNSRLCEVVGDEVRALEEQEDVGEALTPQGTVQSDPAGILEDRNIDSTVKG